MRNFLRGLGLMIAILAMTAPAFAQQMQTERFQNRDVVSQEIIVRFRGSESAESRTQSIRREDSDITATTVVGRSGAVRLRSRGRTVAALIQAYSRRSDVEYAEPNYVWKASDLPNDSFFNDQWAFQNTGQVVGQAGVAGADIKATLAWDVAEGSREIVVGMIDTGIDYTHPDLLSNIWSAPSAFSVTISGQVIQCAAGTHGFNAITRTCDPMDDDGHGTHTAGIVGASGNNAVAVTGVSRVANLMAIKFLNSDGVGTTVNAIAAIEFAIQVKQVLPAAANIRVLNASWGGTDFSQALLDEINLAGANDMLFVASAGNSSVNIDQVPEYPAGYTTANLISVAATNNKDLYASFTNYGAGHVHLAAPGVDILSTLRGTFYGRQSGTSSSAAVVSGAAALILSACELNTAALKSNILSTVDAIPSNPADTATGGRLNVNAAIRSCAGALPESFTVSISPSGRTIDFGLSDQFALNIAALNGFASAINFAATNLPAGMTASFTPNGTQTSSATLTIDIAPNTPQGTYFVGITATGGGVTRILGILVTAGVPTGCTIDPGIGFASGSLVTIDAASIHRPPAYADYCSFTLATDRAIEVEMQGSIDSYIYLLSSSGSVIASDDNGGISGGNALIKAELLVGTYTIEATTAVPGQTGSYTLRLKSTPPEFTSISPAFGIQGTSVAVTITGSVFFGQPITVKVSNCTGTTVSDTQVVNPTTVTATLNLGNQTGTCLVLVSNAGGQSQQRPFSIYPPTPVITSISPDSGLQGQTIPITISGANFQGGKVSTGGIPFSGGVVTSTEIKGNLFVGTNTNPGVYNISVTNVTGTSNVVSFTVVLAPPTFFKIDPSPAGGPGRSVDLKLLGTSFAGVVQVLTGDPRITVTNLVVRNSGTLDARFNVAPDVPYGDYPIRISTAAGISGEQVFKVVPPPEITAFTPNRVFLGRTTNVTFTGTNFYCNRSININGTGVNPGVGSGFGDPCASITTYPFFLTVDNTAALGPRTLTLTAPNGVSNSITIDVQPVPAFIQTVAPAYGAIGTTTNVTIAGTGLSAGTVDISGSGVVATTVSSTATSLTASIAISANAAIGARSLTVTTANGISDPVTFSVTPTTWPDLTVSQSIPPLLARAYDETYSITVRNVGTKETTAPITVIDTLTSGDQFVSVSAGWSCTAASEVVTCITSQSIAINAQVTFQLIVKIGAGPVNHPNTVEVSSPEDYNLLNNKSTVIAPSVSKPTPNIVLSVPSAQPGQQGTISITLPSAFPREIIDSMNVVTLTFFPAIAGMPGDPATQFATGGTTVPFTFKANALTADFPGISGPVGFQLGTVAGTLTFTMSFRSSAGNIVTRTASTTISTATPTIREIVPVKTSTGFEAGITLLTTTREVRTITFQFNTTTPIKLSCGGVAGCSVAGISLNFNVISLFNSWFASNSAYGGVAILRVPFNISQGTIAGTITVTLTNSIGNSNMMTFPIP